MMKFIQRILCRLHCTTIIHRTKVHQKDVLSQFIKTRIDQAINYLYKDLSENS